MSIYHFRSAFRAAFATGNPDDMAPSPDPMWSSTAPLSIPDVSAVRIEDATGQEDLLDMSAYARKSLIALIALINLIEEEVVH